MLHLHSTTACWHGSHSIRVPAGKMHTSCLGKGLRQCFGKDIGTEVHEEMRSCQTHPNLLHACCLLPAVQLHGETSVVGGRFRSLAGPRPLGRLGGLAFWFLGVTGALLWAVLMAFLSLLPAIGAGLVWLPVAIYFLVTGAIWQCVALTAYSVLVIGLVDNLLRPLLVGKDTRMPDYVVMISTLGGMAVMGINGFVLGPAIAAMFIAVWHIYITTGVDDGEQNSTRDEDAS